MMLEKWVLAFANAAPFFCLVLRERTPRSSGELHQGENKSDVEPAAVIKGGDLVLEVADAS